MAVIHTAYRVSQTANADSLTIALRDGIVANDIIYAIVSVRRSYAVLAGTGYNAIINSSAGTTWSTYHMNKIAAGGESSISITNTGATLVGTSATMIANIYIIKDGDVSGTAANAVDMSAQAAWSSGLTMSSPTGTVSSNNCTVIHSAVWDLVTPSVAPSDLNTAIGPGAAGSVASGMRLQTSSGALATFNWVGDTARSGNSFVVAFKNGSGGSLPTYLQDNRSVLARFSGYETYTWVALSTIAASINGINCSSTVATRTTGAIPNSADWVEPGTRLDSSESSGLPCWSGAVAPISCDLSGGNLSIQAGIYSVWDSSRIGSGGIIAVFWDGTNYEAHQLRTLETGATYQGWTTYLTPGQTIPLAYSGTLGDIDWSAITHIGLAYHRASTAGSTTVGIVAGRITLDDGTSIFVGGGTNYPVRAESEYKCLVAANTMSNAADLGGKGQLLLRGGVQYGDGTTPTTVKHTSQSIETPLDTDDDWHCAESSVPIVVRASDSCVIDFSGHILASNTRQPFTIHASSSTLADYNFVATAFIGRDVTWKTGVPCISALFSSCFTIDGKSASFSTCTFSDCQLTSGAYLALDGGASIDYSDAPFLSSSFTRGTEDYAIECRTAGYYDFTGATFSGYTTELYVSTMSGDVYIRLAEGQTVPSYDQAGGSTAVVHLVVPTVVADISITSMPTAVGADRRLQIINTTASAASAWQASTSYTLGDVVLRTAGIGSENTAGLYMRCTSSGTSGGTEPTWDTTVGNTTTDNTVTWTTYAVLFYDADPAASSYSTTYIDGEEFLAGEEVAIRCAEMDGATSFKTYSTAVIAASTGFSALVSEEADTVFATYALDGSAYDTTFSPNYTANYIVLDTNTDFSGASAYAYYCWLLTTSDGMYRFWGGLTALDTGNIRNNDSVISLYFDESAGFVKQTDNVRIFRNDGARPAIDPTTGGNGIEINWRVPVNVVSTGGSALTTEEHDQLMSRPSASDNATAVAAVAVDGDVTLAESMRLQNAMLAGKVSGAGTGTEVFRSLADDKDRATVTVDSSGNRSDVVRDLT